MKKLASLVLCVLLVSSFNLLAQNINTEMPQKSATQTLQVKTKECNKGIMQNCPMMSGNKVDKASMQKMMSNSPMMKNKTPEQKQQMMQNCPMMSGNKMDKVSMQKMMSNCPMMKDKTPEQRQQKMQNCPIMKGKKVD